MHSALQRAITLTVDLERIEAAVREILAAVGEDPEREGLRATPARVRAHVRRDFLRSQ